MFINVSCSFLFFPFFFWTNLYSKKVSADALAPIWAVGVFYRCGPRYSDGPDGPGCLLIARVLFFSLAPKCLFCLGELAGFQHRPPSTSLSLTLTASSHRVIKDWTLSLAGAQHQAYFRCQNSIIYSGMEHEKGGIFRPCRFLMGVGEPLLFLWWGSLAGLVKARRFIWAWDDVLVNSFRGS